MDIRHIRQRFHQEIGAQIIRVKLKDNLRLYNFADISSKASVSIAARLVELLSITPGSGNLEGQTAGKRFEQITLNFVEESFQQLAHLRPGAWVYSAQEGSTNFDQYRQLAG